MYTCSLENSEVKARPLDVYIFLVILLAIITAKFSVCVCAIARRRDAARVDAVDIEAYNIDHLFQLSCLVYAEARPY